jgi:hypothetical protein
MLGEHCTPQVLRAHLLSQKINKFNHIADQIRKELVKELDARKVLTPLDLERRASLMAGQVAESMGELGLFEPDELVQMQHNSLVDLYAAQEFNDTEIEEIINLARKRKRAQELKLVLDKTNPSGEAVLDRLQQFCQLPLGEKRINPSELMGIRAGLIEYFISGHLSFLGVAKNHMTVRGICELMDHVIGPEGGAGRIGGKAAGMLLAMAILDPVLEDAEPEFAEVIRSPKSFFIRSDVVDAFKEHNQELLEVFMHQKYKEFDEIAEEFEEVRAAILKASYPPEIRQKLFGLLEEVGDHPIIVRSSSYLEDNSGFAFSGKYISIFVGNQGPLEKRLEDLETAMKEVYASTFSPDVMAYRKERGLLDYNERMCLLIQEVVGKRYGDYFFPTCAGVAVSRNNFSWSPRIKREDGLMRLVMGLGTRAVDRVGNDYPRLVPLGQPLLRPEAEVQQIYKYSQKFVDVLNLQTNNLETISLKELLQKSHPQGLASLLSVVKDGMLQPMLNAKLDRERYCLTFDGLLKSPRFIKVMHRMIRKLEDAIGHPVEAEFAYQDGKIYILQCRAFSQFEEPDNVDIPEDIPPGNLLFRSRLGFTSAEIRDVEYVVYVDPTAYAELPSYDERLRVARVVSFVNSQLRDRRFVMIGPGRWGSNNLDLGVKVAFADINRAMMLIEIDLTGSEVTPDASFGTHFFHDLVESQIIPLAVQTKEGQSFNFDFFAQKTEVPAKWQEKFKGLEHCVKVLHVPTLAQGASLHVVIDASRPLAVGYLDRRHRDR